MSESDACLIKQGLEFHPWFVDGPICGVGITLSLEKAVALSFNQSPWMVTPSLWMVLSMVQESLSRDNALAWLSFMKSPWTVSSTEQWLELDSLIHGAVTRVSH